MEPYIFNINLNNSEFDNINKLVNTDIHLHLLDTTKTRYDILEKFIYETISRHIITMGLNDDINSYFIEFWTKKKVYNETLTNYSINSFHVDCDENLKQNNNIIVNPIFSCVTYLNDSEFPFILTDIDIESYNFKKFENKNNIKIFFPRKNKQIIFDGSKHHGVIDIFNKMNEESKEFERNIIAINLWKTRPTNIEFYKSNEDYIYNESNNILEFNIISEKKTIYSDTEFSFLFYETMLYRPISFKLPDDITDNIKSIYNNHYYIEVISSTTTKIEINQTNKENYIKKLISDINIINKLSDESDNKLFDKSIINNRFIQRIVYNKFYTKEICEWIIDRTEIYAYNNGGWTTARHDNYPTTDIPLEQIPPLFDFVLFSFNNLFEKIKKSYSIESNINFNICDLFVAKYDSDTQNELKMHRDGSFLSFNILLSNHNDFEGGGTYFDDGITIYLEQGDVVVHSGQILHSGNKITKGIRYILVAFIAIIVECKQDDIFTKNN